MANNIVTKGFKLLDCDVYFDKGDVNGDVLIGGVKSVELKVASDNTVNHNAGSRDPIEIVGGKNTYNGTLEGFWWDSDTLNDYVDFTGNNDFYFTIKGTIKLNNDERQVVIENVKIKGWSLTMNFDDVTSISRDFDALKAYII